MARDLTPKFTVYLSWSQRTLASYSIWHSSTRGRLLAMRKSQCPAPIWVNYSIQWHLSTIDTRIHMLCTQSKFTVCTWLTILYRFTWHLAAAPGEAMSTRIVWLRTDLTYQRPNGAFCRLKISCGMLIRGITKLEDEDKFAVHCKTKEVTLCSVFGHLGTMLVKQNLDELGWHLGMKRMAKLWKHPAVDNLTIFNELAGGGQFWNGG